MGSVRIENACRDTIFGAVGSYGDEAGVMVFGAKHIGLEEGMSGTLMFTPDGEEPDAARPEERVVVLDVSAAWPNTFPGIVYEDDRTEYLRIAPTQRYAIRPLPDAPKRMAVWKSPPTLWPVCSACGEPVDPRRLGELCRNCRALLAKTLTPWPKERSDG